MHILFDTSVLVAAMSESHPVHMRALPWLQRVHASSITGIVASHSLAETYAVLTRLPVQPRITPQLAYTIIRHNIIDRCTIVSLDSDDYIQILAELAQNDLSGGITYDALVIHVARLVRVDHILTLNPRHFQRIAPDLHTIIIEP